MGKNKQRNKSLQFIRHGLLFNATFNNISVMSRQSVLLVERAECPERSIDLWQVTEEPYHVRCESNWQNIIDKLLPVCHRALT